MHLRKVTCEMKIKKKMKTSVCGWCHWEYEKPTGKRIRMLPDPEFYRVETTGICEPCVDSMNESRRAKRERINENDQGA